MRDRCLVLMPSLLLAGCLWAPAADEPSAEARSHYEAGAAAKKANDLPRAADELREATRLAPRWVDARWTLAWVYAGLQDKATAVEEFNWVICLAPGDKRTEDAKAAIERLGGAVKTPEGAVAQPDGSPQTPPEPKAPTTTPSYINPQLASAYYEVVMHALGTQAPDPDRAVQLLGALPDEEASNALRAYLLAAAYAAKNDWKVVAEQLKAGNEAVYYVCYQQIAGPFNLHADHSRLRQLARACRDAGPNLEAEQAAALLRAIRVMGKRVAGSEPTECINLVSGHAIRAIGDQALVALCEQAGRVDDTEAARTLTDADEAWWQHAKAEIEALPGGADRWPYLKAKHGITEEEFKAYPAPLAADTQRKFDAMTEEVKATEGPLVEKWLATMPD